MVQPGNRPLDNPAFWQHHETAGVRALDDLDVDHAPLRWTPRPSSCGSGGAHDDEEDATRVLAEFKREAVVLLRESGRPLTQVASELGLEPPV